MRNQVAQPTDATDPRSMTMVIQVRQVLAHHADDARAAVSVLYERPNCREGWEQRRATLTCSRPTAYDLGEVDI